MKIYNANTLCSTYFDKTILLRLLLLLLLLIKYHDERFEHEMNYIQPKSATNTFHL